MPKRLCSISVDDPIRCRQRFQVTGITNISVDKAAIFRLQKMAILFAAGTAQIVNTENFETLDLPLELQREGAADKSADAGNENPQPIHWICNLSCQALTIS